jgi:hypothetical protein
MKWVFMSARKNIKHGWMKPFLYGLAVAVPLSALSTWTVFKRQTGGFGSTPESIHPASTLVDGPGGRIEALKIPLANPGGKLPDEHERMKPVSWFFEDCTAEQLDSFLRSLSGTAGLLDQEQWQRQTNGWVITPPESTVWGLPPDVRQRLYTLLARSPANYPQYAPFTFPAGRFQAALAAAGIPDRRIQQMEKLTYTRAGATCFSDLQLAREKLSGSEYQSLVETLYQIPTYRLQLHVRPDSDVDELVRYWGRGGRSERIHPLLKSLARVPEGASTSVSLLLPDYARLHLYTYPESWSEPTASRQDCFYAALNFFRDVPDTNFLDKDYIVRVLATEYAEAVSQPTYGDLVMVHDLSGNIIHACVYIVANFVFTKNGVSSGQPWVFMDFQDMMLAYQGQETPNRISVLRRKESVEQVASTNP